MDLKDDSFCRRMAHDNAGYPLPWTMRCHWRRKPWAQIHHPRHHADGTRDSAGERDIAYSFPRLIPLSGGWMRG